MTTSPFTLAALASAAVEDRAFIRANIFTSGQIGDYDTALLEDESGEQLLIRIPTSQRACDDLEADLRGINAMSAGIRSRLPFTVPKAIGHVDHEPFDGLVVTYIGGVPIDLNGLEPHNGVADALGMAIAGIHNLPTGFVDDYGLPNQAAGLVQDSLSNLVDRAAYDAKLPIPLVTRWNAAISEDPWWDFTSTVIHGDLSESLVIMQQGQVSGVLGWHNLAIGDPARDLGWCLTPVSNETADAIVSAYTTRREGEADEFIVERARLYGELSLAEWLMHGIEDEDATIEQDARAMIDDLLQNVEQGTIADLVAPTTSAGSDADANRSIVVSMFEETSDSGHDDATKAGGDISSQDETDAIANFATSDLIDPADAIIGASSTPPAASDADADHQDSGDDAHDRTDVFSAFDSLSEDAVEDAVEDVPKSVDPSERLDLFNDMSDHPTESLTGSHALLLTEVVEAEVVEDEPVDDDAFGYPNVGADDATIGDNADDILDSEPLADDPRELPTEAFGHGPLSVIEEVIDEAGVDLTDVPDIDQNDDASTQSETTGDPHANGGNN